MFAAVRVFSDIDGPAGRSALSGTPAFLKIPRFAAFRSALGRSLGRGDQGFLKSIR
jgi:hypothetical protein